MATFALARGDPVVGTTNTIRPTKAYNHHVVLNTSVAQYSFEPFFPPLPGTSSATYTDPLMDNGFHPSFHLDDGCINKDMHLAHRENNLGHQVIYTTAVPVRIGW